MNKSNTKCFETISKSEYQSSNISDKDIDDGNHDIEKGSYAFSSVCRGNLGCNLLAKYLQISHILYKSSTLQA